MRALALVLVLAGCGGTEEQPQGWYCGTLEDNAYVSCFRRPVATGLCGEGEGAVQCTHVPSAWCPLPRDVGGEAWGLCSNSEIDCRGRHDSACIQVL